MHQRIARREAARASFVQPPRPSPAAAESEQGSAGPSLRRAELLGHSLQTFSLASATDLVQRLPDLNTFKTASGKRSWYDAIGKVDNALDAYLKADISNLQLKISRIRALVGELFEYLSKTPDVQKNRVVVERLATDAEKEWQWLEKMTILDASRVPVTLQEAEDHLDNLSENVLRQLAPLPQVTGAKDILKLASLSRPVGEIVQIAAHAKVTTFAQLYRLAGQPLTHSTVSILAVLNDNRNYTADQALEILDTPVSGLPQVGATRPDYLKALGQAVEALAGVGFEISVKGKYDDRYWEEATTIFAEDYKTELLTFRNSQIESLTPRQEQLVSETPKDTGRILIHLKVKEGIKPSTAVREIAKSPDKWTLDCTEFVQVAHLLARIETGSDEDADALQDFRLQQHGSTLLTGATTVRYNKELDHWETHGPGGKTRIPQGKAYGATVLGAAPVGSRVTWRNEAGTGTAFGFENTVKVGDDLYAAHGFSGGKLFTRQQIEDNLASLNLQTWTQPSDLLEAFNATQEQKEGRSGIYVIEIETYQGMGWEERIYKLLTEAAKAPSSAGAGYLCRDATSLMREHNVDSPRIQALLAKFTL